jgi:hypothetical protein
MVCGAHDVAFNANDWLMSGLALQYVYERKWVDMGILLIGILRVICWPGPCYQVQAAGQPLSRQALQVASAQQLCMAKQSTVCPASCLQILPHKI